MALPENRMSHPNYCYLCDEIHTNKCCPEKSEGAKIAEKEMQHTVETYKIVGIEKVIAGSILHCEICNEPKPDPKAEWRCLNCAGKLFYASDVKAKASSVFEKEIWNAAIEAAALSCKPKDCVDNNSEWSRGFIYAANNTALMNADAIRRLKK